MELLVGNHVEASTGAGRRMMLWHLSPQYTALAVKRLEEVPLPMMEVT
mgnify:CR=1 FL=1